VSPVNEQAQLLKSGIEETSIMMKRSVKTSGIEDNDGGKVTIN